MAKISKRKLKQHEIAKNLLKKDILTDVDVEFFYENWNEGAFTDNQFLGAFFTPLNMAFDFILDAIGQIGANQKIRVIDLCAGNGVLSKVIKWRYGDQVDLVSVEFNQLYCEIGKKLVPDSKWVHGSVTDKELMESLGKFDIAVSNPPFGKIKTFENNYDYTRKDAEYLTIEVASKIAKYGSFIIPQGSAPFKFSGVQSYQSVENNKYKKFSKETGIVLTHGMGCDTTCYDDFKNTKIITEFVHTENQYE